MGCFTFLLPFSPSIFEFRTTAKWASATPHTACANSLKTCKTATKSKKIE